MNKVIENNKIEDIPPYLGQNWRDDLKNFLSFPPLAGLTSGTQVLWAGRPAVEIARHVNVVAACAAFAFLGAILFGAF